MEDLVAIRKKFHERPETCWTEFWTTAEICKYLESFGFTLMVGKQIIKEDLRGMVPDFQTIDKWYQNAIALGADIKYLEKMKGGFTGVIGILDTKKEGPTFAFRADIDALPISESKEESHTPFREGWASKHEGYMHACGHDCHTTVGIGIANYIAQNKDSLRGKFILIFSPAEEGGHGCLSISKLPIVKDIDYFITYHFSTYPLKGHHYLVLNNISLSLEGYEVEFAREEKLREIQKLEEELKQSQKFISDIDFMNELVKRIRLLPYRGNDAINAACKAIMRLQSLCTPGQSEINIRNFHSGKLEELSYNWGGTSSNPCRFYLVLRAANDEIANSLRKKAFKILKDCAKKYNVNVKWKEILKYHPSWNYQNSPKLMKLAAQAWKELGMGDYIVDQWFHGGDDVFFIMREIVKNGGHAAHFRIVSDDDGGRMKGQHDESGRFDINNDLLHVGVKLFAKIVEKILNNNAC